MGIVYALIIMMASTILSTIFAAIAVIGGIFGSSSAGSFVALTVICVLALIGGFIWFFVNLTKFIDMQQNTEDRTAVSNIRTAYIIMIVGNLLMLIPIAGIFINLICAIVGYILLLIAYGNFSNSKFMNANGCAGASLLKTATIINIICSILMIIPFINILAMIGLIVALVLVFIGWTKVADGIDEMPEKREETIM